MTAANVVRVEDRVTFKRVHVLFTDTGYSETVTFDVSRNEELIDRIRSFIQLRERAQALVIATGPVDQNVLFPPAPDPPTQEEVDARNFRDLISSYKKLRAELDAGVGTAKQGDVDALVGEIKLAYKDVYADMIVGVF